jgi:menaquinone-dependent protoporphyrinogen IX oxidase
VPRILVVHFSRTGHTRQVAQSIATALAADIEEIVDPTRRTGILGYFRSGREAWLKRLPSIAPSVHDPGRYDMVVIGTPIWNTSLSAPVRSYLWRHRSRLPAVAFFLTCGGMGIDRVFRQMTEESGRAAVATLAVREKELGTPALEAAIARFTGEVTHALAPAHLAQPA